MSNAWLELLITQTWQLSLVILIVGLLARWLQKTQPHFAALLWLIVLAKAVTPPVWSSPVGLFSWSFPSVAENTVAVAEPANSPLVTVTVADETYSGRVDSLGTPQSAVEESPKESAVQNPDGEDWELADSSPDILISPVAPFEGDVSRELDPLSGAPLSQPVQFVEAQPQREINSNTSWPAFLPEAAVIVTVWFCGVMVMVLFTLVRFLWLMGRLARAGRVEDAALEELVQKLRQRLRIRQKVALWVTPTNRGPAVVGCRRPCLLLPLALTQIGHPHHLEPILAHELLHIRRGDLWLGWWQTAVQCVWWFHPLVWWANRSLTRLLERCCDDEVLAELDCAPAHYARSLLSTLELKHRLHPVPTAPSVRPVDLTRERMERIMRRQHGSRSRTPWWGWGLLALGLAITLPGAAKSLTADEPASESVPTPELEVINVTGVGVDSENGVPGTPTFEKPIGQPASTSVSHKKSWQTYDISDVLKQMAATIPDAEERQRAVLNEIVSIAVQNPQTLSGVLTSSPVFRQIVWEGETLKLEATADEHKELQHLLTMRRQHPIESETPIRIQMRWYRGNPPQEVTDPTDPDQTDANHKNADQTDAISPAMMKQPQTTVLTAEDEQKVLQELGQQPEARLLSAPQILVRNGQVGMIQVGSGRPFVTDTRPGDQGRQAVIRLVEDGLSWLIRPTRREDGSIHLWLQMQQQQVTGVEVLKAGDYVVQAPSISAWRQETAVRLESGQHLMLRLPGIDGQDVIGFLTVAVDEESQPVSAVKPEPLSATSQHTAQFDPPTFQNNSHNFQTKRPTFQKSPPNFQTKQPFLHGGDGRIYYQISSSNRIPPETPVRIRLSGKRSTIASEFLAKQANPPKTVAEAMTKLPEQLREEYHTKGYHFARIEATLVTEKPVVAKDWSPSQFPTAVIYVNEGPRVVQAVWSDPTQQKGTLHVELHKNLSYEHLSKALYHHYWRKGCFAVELSGRAIKEAPSSPETTAYQVKIDHGWPSILGGLQVHPVPPEMMQAGLPTDFPAKIGERFDAAQIEAACQSLHQWFAQHGNHETSIQVSFNEFRRSKQVQAHFFVQGPKLTQQPNGQSLKIGQVEAAAEPKVTIAPISDDTPVRFRVEGAKTDIAKKFLSQTSVGLDYAQKATTWLPERLLSEFQSQGYPFATVDVRIRPTCEGCFNPEYEAVFAVQEGPKVVQQEWTNLDGDDPRRGRTGTVLVDFVPGSEMNAAAGAIGRHFHSDGYLDVQVTTAHVPAPSPDAPGQHLICKVATGPQYRVRQIQVTPILTSDIGKVDGLPDDFPMHPQDYYSRQKSVLAVRSLEQFVRRYGFLDATVTRSVARTDQPGYLDVVFTIRTASQQSFAPPAAEMGTKASPVPYGLPQAVRGAGQKFRSSGQTRPSPYYLQEDIQYFPAPVEAAALKTATTATTDQGPEIVSQNWTGENLKNPDVTRTGVIHVHLPATQKPSTVIKALTERFHRDGYFDVKVAEQPSPLITDDHLVESPADRPVRKLVMQVETGPRYHVSKILVTSGFSHLANSLNPPPDGLPMQLGDVCTRSKLDQAVTWLQDNVRKNESPEATVKAHLAFASEAGKMHVLLNVQHPAADKSQVGEVVFENGVRGKIRFLSLNLAESQEGSIPVFGQPATDSIAIVPPLSADRASKYRDSTKTSDELQKKLDGTVAVIWKETPLENAVEELAKLAQIKILLEPEGLAEAKTTPQTAVNLAIKEITVRSALKLLGDAANLGVRFEADQVVLTSKERSVVYLAMTYPVADLVVPLPEPSQVPENAESDRDRLKEAVTVRAARLMALVQSSVSPDNWWSDDPNHGAITFYGDTKSLVVWQTAEHHQQIAGLLGKLRRKLDLQVSFHIRDRVLTADEWKTLNPEGVSPVVMIPPDKATTASLSITAFNAQRIPLLHQANLSKLRGDVEILSVVSADRRSMTLSIFPATTPSLFQATSLAVEDQQAILVDISDTLPQTDPRLKDGSRVVLQVTPKIIVQAEEEERLGSPQK